MHVAKWMVAVVLACFAATAHAQLMVPPPATSFVGAQPTVPVGYQDPPYHLAFGIGTSGTGFGGSEQRLTAGIEGSADTRVTPLLSLGVHGHWSLRNWNVIDDYYSNGGINDLYGYAFGWVSGTSMLGLGPELVIAPARRVRPWLALGTTLFLYINTRAPGDHVIWGHAGYGAVGFDLPGGVGFSLRAQYAPASGTVFGTTSSPVVTALAMFDVRFLGR